MTAIARILAVLVLALAIAVTPERAMLAGQHVMAAPCPNAHDHHGSPGGDIAAKAGSGHAHAPRLPDLACASWCAAQCAGVCAVMPAGDAAGMAWHVARLAFPDDALSAGLNPVPDPPPPRRAA